MRMCSRNVHHSLLLADGDPGGPVQFANSVDQRSSKSMPKSKYDVPHLLMQYETERHAGPESEGKVDGTLLEHHQVFEGCHLVQRLPRSVERHDSVDGPSRRTT